MKSIAIASIINSGFLTTLVNADVTYLFPSLPLQMTYSDLDVDWYLMIGTTLTKTMLIASIMPWILFFVEVAQYYFMICLDKPCCSCCAKSAEVNDADDNYTNANLIK